MRRLLLFLLLNACNALTGIDEYSSGSRDGGSSGDAGAETGPVSCDGAVIECWSCPSGTPALRCSSPSDTTNCLNDTTYSHCGCKVVGDCPGNGTQTCAVRAGATRECKTCGEPGTDGLPCKNAMTCDAAAHACN